MEKEITTVGELIAELKLLPENKAVLVYGGEYPTLREEETYVEIA